MAAEHWDLTEQFFRGALVYTARSARPREQTIQGIPFVLKRTQPERIFGVRPVWRERVKVLVSDPHRTIIDMLDDPATGGGIRHVNACLRNCLAFKEADTAKLIDYADRLGDGAVFKRLGIPACADER